MDVVIEIYSREFAPLLPLCAFWGLFAIAGGVFLHFYQKRKKR
jgi:hypothetical protein